MSKNIVLSVLGILGIALIVVGVVIGFAVFDDDYIRDEIADQVRLENGTEQYERWEKLPFPLTFKVYFFQVNNPEEVLAGALPSVTEVGPYVYKQHRHKENIEFDDTLRYIQIQNYEFDPVASDGLTEEDKITVLNVPLQGVLQTAEMMGSTQISAANLGWKNAFGETSLFHEVDVKSYLFGGYKFCAKSVLGLAKILCNNVRAMAADIKTLSIEDDADERVVFTFFGHKDNHDDGLYEIDAGLENAENVGEILSWENEESINNWDPAYPECNRIRGRDSSIYPPYIEDDTVIDIFNTDICRIVTLKHSGTDEYKDIEGVVRKLGIEAMSNTGEQECYCIKGTKNLKGEYDCLPEGFGDMKSCLGAPVVATFPHLLWADEEYQKTVVGLTPNENDHVTYVTIEPNTGSPLKGAKRMQFNMLMRNIEGIAITNDITPHVMPLIWVEEGVELTDELVQKLKDDYFSKLTLLDAVTWTLIGVGIAVLLGTGAFAFFKK